MGNVGRRDFLRGGFLGTLTAGTAAVLAACDNRAPEIPKPGASGSSAAPGGDKNAAINPGTAQQPAIRVGADSRLGKILAAKKIVVGISVQNKPGAYRDESGKPIGFYVETVERLAEDLGVTLEIADQEWAGLIPGVISGKIDLASQALTNTPARARSMFFSGPYAPNAQTLVVQKAKKRSSVDAYSDPSVKLVALQGSTESLFLQSRFPKAQYVGLPDNNAVMLEVISGRADGAIITVAAAIPFIKSNPSVDFFQLQPLSYEFGALAMQYGDWELKNWVDEWLRYWKAKGWIQAIYRKWYEPFLGDLVKNFEIPRY